MTDPTEMALENLIMRHLAGTDGLVLTPLKDGTQVNKFVENVSLHRLVSDMVCRLTQD